MLCDSKLPKYFWAEAISIACYVINRVLIRPILNKTSYELFYDRIPKISYFKVFGCKCFILNTKDNLDKFDSKSDEVIFVGYSMRSKAHRIFNKKTSTIEESLHVNFDENYSHDSIVNNDDDIVENVVKDVENIYLKDSHDLPIAFREIRDHPHENVIGNISDHVKTGSQLNLFSCVAFTSLLEPKNVNDVILDEFWLIAMKE